MTDAIVYHGSGEGRALEVGGDLVFFKASRDEGFRSLFIELTCPPGGGPPPHTDPLEELFYVLEGEFEFVSPGPEGLTARPLQVGDSVCVPRGVPHAYRNVGTQPGRLLVFFPQNGAHARILRRTRRPRSRSVYVDLLWAAAARASDHCGKALGDRLRPAGGAVARAFG